jgi:hypothetical protein
MLYDDGDEDDAIEWGFFTPKLLPNCFKSLSALTFPLLVRKREHYKIDNVLPSSEVPIILLPSFYLCNVCHAIFGNKPELDRHILTHAGSKGGGEEGIYSKRRVPRGSHWW